MLEDTEHDRGTDVSATTSVSMEHFKPRGAYAESPVRTMLSSLLMIPIHRPCVSMSVRYASKPSSIAQGYGSNHQV